jgi:hypothetical protein
MQIGDDVPQEFEPIHRLIALLKTSNGFRLVRSGVPIIGYASSRAWSFANYGTRVLRLRVEGLDLIAPGLPMKASQDKISSRAYALDASRTRLVRTAVQT